VQYFLVVRVEALRVLGLMEKAYFSSEGRCHLNLSPVNRGLGVGFGRALRRKLRSFSASGDQKNRRGKRGTNEGVCAKRGGGHQEERG